MCCGKLQEMLVGCAWRVILKVGLLMLCVVACQGCWVCCVSCFVPQTMHPNNAHPQVLQMLALQQQSKVFCKENEFHFGVACVLWSCVCCLSRVLNVESLV